MKKWIMLLGILMVCQLSQAQMFSTKTGVVSFFSSTPLEDIKARSTDMESKLMSTTGQVVFLMLVNSFRFENELMEEHFNESYLHTDKFPKAEFRGSITNIGQVNFQKDGTYPATAAGKLTMHGVTRDVTASGTVVVQNGKPTVHCKFPVRVRDYNIAGKIIGKELAETVTVTVDCRYE